MARKTLLQPESLPKPAIPVALGTKKGNIVYTAGLFANNAKGELVGIGDIRKQTEQTMENIKAVLAEAGATLADVIKVTVFIKDMADYAGMNEVYSRYFPKDDCPARATVQATLFRPEVLVEIEALAVT
jgi:2-iminobutanoate/2-iminopropanoate deaminase